MKEGCVKRSKQVVQPVVSFGKNGGKGGSIEVAIPLAVSPIKLTTDVENLFFLFSDLAVKVAKSENKNGF